MKIPWDPITSGAGSFGPAQPTKAFMNYYATPGGEVSHKAFMNLPMNTEAPPVIVPSAGAKHGSKIRDLPTGDGYKDSFITHPVPGNYVEIIAKLDSLREANKKQIEEDRDNYPTLLALVEQGYTNIGRSADEQAQNSIRDRLRQSGASDEEIEIIMKEARLRKLREISITTESKEQEQMRLLLNMRRIQGSPQKQDKPIARADQNVYNFPMPAPLLAHMNNPVAEPGNEIFAGRKKQGVNPPGAPSLEGVMARLSARSTAQRTLDDIIMAASGASRVKAGAETTESKRIRFDREPISPATQRSAYEMTGLQRKALAGPIYIPKGAVEEFLKPLQAASKQKPVLPGTAPPIVRNSPYEAQYLAATSKGKKQKITRQAKLEAMID